MRNPKLIIFTLILIVNGLLHIRAFKSDLISMHVWRQTQTQTVIDNFSKEDLNILNPRINCRGNGDGISRMEFPIMQWIFALFFKIFGDHIIISRILSFCIGFASIIGIYKLIKTITNNIFPALTGAWCLSFSPSFFYYMVNPLPDNFALCMIIWGLFFSVSWFYSNKFSDLILCGLFLCFGSLAKLPFIIYFGFPVFLIVFNTKKFKEFKLKYYSFFLFVIPVIIWYAISIPHWKGNPVVSGILGSKSSILSALDNFQFITFSTLPELIINLAAVPFFIIGFFYILKYKIRNTLFKPFAVLGFFLILYYFYEINAIAKTHDYYLFPFIPLIFIITAYGAWISYHTLNRKWNVVVIIILCFIPLATFFRMKSRWNTQNPGFNKDLLIYKTELRNSVNNNSICVAGNDKTRHVFYYYINKKGWCFDNDILPADSLRNMISNGARYLYSDSRIIDQNPDIQKYIDSLILEKGSFRVFKLKNK